MAPTVFQRISDPKISFVIPAYNEEAQLPRCLAAVIAEIDRVGCPAEIIVVNNASTDGTGALARSYDHVIVVDEPEKSLVKARQAGLAAAAGELIANIDADTVIPPGWLRQVLAEFADDPALIGLSGPYIFDDVSPVARLAVRGFYRSGQFFQWINQRVFGVGAMMQGGNFIVARTAIEAIGGFSNKFDFYGEDTDIACRLARIGKVKFLFTLRAYSSGRRIQHEGLFGMGLRYGVNFIWTTFFRRPFTKEWIDVR